MALSLQRTYLHACKPECPQAVQIPSNLASIVDSPAQRLLQAQSAAPKEFLSAPLQGCWRAINSVTFYALELLRSMSIAVSDGFIICMSVTAAKTAALGTVAFYTLVMTPSILKESFLDGWCKTAGLRENSNSLERVLLHTVLKGRASEVTALFHNSICPETWKLHFYDREARCLIWLNKTGWYRLKASAGQLKEILRGPLCALILDQVVKRLYAPAYGVIGGLYIGHKLTYTVAPALGYLIGYSAYHTYATGCLVGRATKACAHMATLSFRWVAAAFLKNAN